MVSITRNFKNCLGVFQGGGCKALAYVGAYEEAHERGVFFSELAGTSAGSIIAALIAAGANPKDLRRIVADTNFEQFKANPVESSNTAAGPLVRFGSIFSARVRAIRNLGFYSSQEIEVWLEASLRALLAISANEPVRFDQLNVPLSVVATELGSNQPMVWSNQSTPTASVAYAVRCSCNIPVFFQPVHGRYVDGGLISNLPSFLFTNKEDRRYERILLFGFKPNSSVKPVGGPDAPTNIGEFLRKLISTTIDGASSIQMDLQDDVHQIEIDNLPLDTTDFHLISETTLPQMFEQGRKAAHSFFDQESINVKPDGPSRTLLHTESQALNEISRYEPRSGDEVLIHFSSNKLAYSLFPTLFAWHQHGVKVRFSSKSVAKTRIPDHDSLRQLILHGLGNEIRINDALDFEAVHVQRDNSPHTTICIRTKEHSPDGVWRGVTYDRIYDHTSMHLIANELRLDGKEPALHALHAIKGRLRRGDNNELISRLREVEQYSGRDIGISLQDIDLTKVRFLTRYVKAYKYSQIRWLFDAADAAGLDLTDNIWLDYMPDGASMFSMPVTPPVLENHGGELFLIEGNTRIIYMLRELKRTSAKAIVISNVSAALPAKDRLTSSKVVISDDDKTGNTRYEGFNYQAYRKIEEAVRHPKFYLRQEHE